MAALTGEIIKEHNEYLEILAKAISESLDQSYKRHIGFALIVFDFNSKTADYISNSERNNMVEALRETADRIEKNEIIPPPIGNA